MQIFGTKTHVELENEEAERLVRLTPKVKPPRRDKRREDMRTERDPDIDGDPDIKRDQDRSLNYKTVGGAARVAARFLLSRDELVSVRNKETGHVVNVSEETLKGEDASKYEKLEDEPKQDPEPEFASQGEALRDLAKDNPKLQAMIKDLTNPKSDLGGLAEGNPSLPASTVLKNVKIPEGLKTLGDLVKSLRAPKVSPKVKSKAPKEKGPKPAEKAPEGNGHRWDESGEYVEPEKAPVPPPEAGTPPETPEAPETPPETPSDGAEPDPFPEPKKPQAPKFPPTDARGYPPPKKRPPPTRQEELEALDALDQSDLPASVQSSLARLHPTDLKNLLASYSKFQSLPVTGSLKSEIQAARDGYVSKPEDVKTLPDDLGSKKKEKKKTEGGPEEDDTEAEAEAVQQHRMSVMAASLASQVRVTKIMTSSGVPTYLAGKLAYFTLTTAAMPPEKQMEVARQAAQTAFTQAATGFSGKSEKDDRFGSFIDKAKRKLLGDQERKDFISAIDHLDPYTQMAAVAHLQGEDYRAASDKFLGDQAKNPISGYDPPKVIKDKLQAATKMIREAGRDYPLAARVALVDPATVFRVRARESLSGMPPEKKAELTEALLESDAEDYEKADAEYTKHDLPKFEKAYAKYEQELKRWESEKADFESDLDYRESAKPFEKEPPQPPLKPEPPRKPIGYEKVRPPTKQDQEAIQKELDHARSKPHAEEEDSAHAHDEGPKLSWKERAKGLSDKAKATFQASPKVVKQFIEDDSFRRKTLMDAHAALLKAPEKIAKRALDTAKHEVKEFKEAGQGIASVLRGGKMTSHQKKAFKTVATHMAISVAAAALTASGPLAIAGAVGKGMVKHVAMKAVANLFGHLHILEEVGHIGHGVKHLMEHLASTESPDPEEVLSNLVLAAVAKEVPKLDHDGIQSALEGEQESTEKVVASIYSSYQSSKWQMTSSNRTALYHGVEPSPQTPYSEWQQAHQRDLAPEDSALILSAARAWLRSPVLSSSIEGMVPDARFRAALDLAIRESGDGKYSGAITANLYNQLLASLARTQVKVAKLVRITPKEVSRGSGGVTIIARPQVDGTYWVTAVKIDGNSGTPMGRPYEQYVSKDDVPQAIKEVNRWLDKMGFGGDMSDASRNRMASQRTEVNTQRKVTMIKFAKSDANNILARLDRVAAAIQENHAKWGMGFDVAKELVNDLDKTADEIEKASFGEESLVTRQVEVLKQAKVLQQDKDEKYMGTYNAPSAVHQSDRDEKYMSLYEDDQTQAVVSGKSSVGRPLT